MDTDDIRRSHLYVSLLIYVNLFVFPKYFIYLNLFKVICGSNLFVLVFLMSYYNFLLLFNYVFFLFQSLLTDCKRPQQDITVSMVFFLNFPCKTRIFHHHCATIQKCVQYKRILKQAVWTILFNYSMLQYKLRFIWLLYAGVTRSDHLVWQIVTHDPLFYSIFSW